jgi:beta-glucosidase
MAEATFTFPSDFLWGTATAAHQVEGDNTLNDWWDWEQSSQGGDHIYMDQTSGPACDWWNNAEADVERMAALGNNTHRLSVEWSRIEPRPDAWNLDAIDRYRALLSTMRDVGIKPMVTLHHFTNPGWFAERGGWLEPESVLWFQRFARKVAGELADLCDLWCTVNEPTVLASKGYLQGDWPPGQRNLRHYFLALYHLLQAHAAAYHAIHDVQPEAHVGLAQHMPYVRPRAERSPLDRLVARLLDHNSNRITLDALTRGVWHPTIARKQSEPRLKGTLDWIGLNYYTRQSVRFKLLSPGRLFLGLEARPEAEVGPDDWGEIDPAGLFESIRRLVREVGLPIYVTENGLPDEFDRSRPRFILQHVQQVWRAVTCNWPVMGYYFWSLVDNFEWARGWDPRYRFGLYALDRTTQVRTLRTSGALYAEICKANAISSDMAHRYAPEVVEEMFPGSSPGAGGQALPI